MSSLENQFVSLPLEFLCEMVQGSISSVLVDSMESNENRDVLSPEDKFSICSQNRMTASEPGSNDLPRGTGNLMHPSNEAENLQSRVVTDDEKEDDDSMMSLPVGPGLDMGFTASDTEPSTEDVFKVWDLGIPDEEDELIKQLNKVLAENPAQSTPSSSDDPGAGKDLKEESLGILIHGISDLSFGSTFLIFT
ncbi:hypothetical protein OIU76_030065 [Salix suchowensis]|nr:hypothetical protein OIU76_030065 [Salix suchowensis]